MSQQEGSIFENDLLGEQREKTEGNRFGFQQPQFYYTLPSKINEAADKKEITPLNSVSEYWCALKEMQMADLAVFGYKFSDDDKKHFEELTARIKHFERTHNINRP